MRLNSLDINIYERRFILIKKSLLIRSGLNLRIRTLSDIFNEVLTVVWHVMKLSIFIPWSALRP